MKTITLKLTDREFELVYSSLDKANLIDRDLDDSSKIGFSVIDGMNSEEYAVSIYDVDKFRKFLNDKIESYKNLNSQNALNMKGYGNWSIIESILSKLDKKG